MAADPGPNLSRDSFRSTPGSNPAATRQLGSLFPPEDGTARCCPKCVRGCFRPRTRKMTGRSTMTAGSGDGQDDDGAAKPLIKTVPNDLDAR